MNLLDDPETLKAFIEESREHLDGIEDDLLAIEEAGANIDAELVNKVFRAVHSIKGGAGFLGLEKVKELAHASENVMGLIRNGELVPTPEIVTALLDAIDHLSTLINTPETSNEADITNDLNSLQALTKGGGAPAASPSPAQSAQEKPDPQAAASPQKDQTTKGAPLFSVPKPVVEQEIAAQNNVFLFSFDVVQDLQAKNRGITALINELEETGQIIGCSLDLADRSDIDKLAQTRDEVSFLFSTIIEESLLHDFIDLNPQRILPITLDLLGNLESFTPEEAGQEAEESAMPAPCQTQPPAVRKKTETLPAAQKREAPPTQAIKAESTIRVNVKLLDTLMTLAGELVLTRNQLVQAVSSGHASGIDSISQRLDHVTSELQEAIMGTRMQPVGSVFNKFKRIVRDLCKNLNKQTNLIISGEDVELDKTIIESIGDPLTHLIRNSVDHGIEMPDARVEAGKSPEGTVKLTAYHEGGHVMITIEDDGAGINLDRVKEKVLSMGSIDPSTLDAMGPKDLAKLIFLPGMSTAKEVTDVSGRGVGMDVVHTNIAKVGGNIDIETNYGSGTLITIKLPLTLAIIPSLIISVQGERFAIPQVNLVELVRIPAAKIKERLEKIGDALVMRLRGDLLPLIRLSDALDIGTTYFHHPEKGDRRPDRRKRLEDRRQQAETTDSTPPEQEEPLQQRSDEDRRAHPLSAYNVVVVSAGDYQYGLIVDHLLDSEEIVVKPLGSHLRDCKCYAGATVQGDGRIALILDIIGISQLMQLNTVSQTVREQARLKHDEDLSRLKDVQPLLIVRNSKSDQMAIPLDLVSRIEKISSRAIEVTGGKKNMQYRGGSLPLFSIDEVADVAPPNEEQNLVYVVVFPISGKEVGIIFSEVIDIVTLEITVDDTTHKQSGILGSAIILDKITLLVDLYGVVTTLMPQWDISKSKSTDQPSTQRILIVEDSPFFMNQLVTFIQEAGYEPYTATDGLEGIEVLGKKQIDLILTDIEMPNLNGLEMTKQIRQHEKWHDLPIIAVTSLAGNEAEKRGMAAGVNEYMVKLDREKIIRTVRRYLSS